MTNTLFEIPSQQKLYKINLREGSSFYVEDNW